MNDISPRDLLERLFRRWPVITLAIILGGVVGWLTSYLFPPIYEARAEVYLELDSNLWAQENHPGNPIEFAIANSIRPLTALFYSDATIRDLVSAAQEENIPLDKRTVLTTFTIQSIDMTWLMEVRSGNPQHAARLADLWVQAALPIHQAAHEHAVNAYAFTVQRDALLACFNSATLTAGNACAGTSFPSLADLEPAIAKLDAQIAIEKDTSLGLDPALTIRAGAPATEPAGPVRDRRSWLALAGTLIGLILGVIASQTTFPLQKETVRVE